MVKVEEPCSSLKGTPAYDYCMEGAKPEDGGTKGGGDGGPPDGLTDGASSHVKDLAEWLISKMNDLLAPNKAWAPEKADSPLYAPFLWLGQHLAVSIFICTVAVCGITAWQGTPRLRQLGLTTGWTMAAVAAMASIPGIAALLNDAVSQAFRTMFSSDGQTLFGVIKEDLASGADSGNPLAILIIMSALCVALGFATLVFAVRNPGILAFVCMAPVVLASLARSGDTSAVLTWAQRLLGLMMAPFAFLLASLFVPFVEGSLVMDAVLLIAADVLMLRMIFHGIPYVGPRLAGAAREMIERRTDNRLVRGALKAGVPDVYEQENVPRGPRLVSTPGRAMSRDGSVLFAAYGGRPAKRSGRLTTDSAVEQINHDADRRNRVFAARRAARTTRNPNSPNSGSNPNRAPNPRPAAPDPGPPAGGQSPPGS